jgi:hypothetical protein
MKSQKIGLSASTIWRQSKYNLTVTGTDLSASADDEFSLSMPHSGRSIAASSDFGFSESCPTSVAKDTS